ncbi:HAMP domain-containing histidine kinase [[Clostridium] innocuum]|nr:HAMP domain-containing histidine kinase [[Clostridium] innocuum]
MKKNSFRSLRTELLLLCLAAFGLCLLFHIAASEVSMIMIDSYFNDDQNIETMEKKKLDSLQTYIIDKKIALNELEQINGWLSSQTDVLIKIYHNGYLMYDSIYGLADNNELSLESKNDYPNFSYYTLDLEDAKVEVSLLCYDYTLQNNVGTMISIITVVLFFYIVIRGVRKKIKYLIQLYDDLNALSCDLSHEMHIAGNDEITQVAYRIESLRNSVIEKMDDEKRAYDTNMQLVTTLSHDIKTPLTSIIGFLELAKNNSKENQMNYHYLDIALEKSFHLNNLLNELFSHFLLHSNSYEIQFEKVDTGILINQILEEYLYELETKGAIINRDIHDVTSEISVNINLFQRLISNIFSNINKYADLNKPISIQYYLAENTLIIKIKNSKKTERNFTQNSTKIGLNNCRAIMQKHKGEFVSYEDADSFVVELHFPVY